MIGATTGVYGNLYAFNGGLIGKGFEKVMDPSSRRTIANFFRVEWTAFALVVGQEGPVGIIDIFLLIGSASINLEGKLLVGELEDIANNTFFSHARNYNGLQ